MGCYIGFYKDIRGLYRGIMGLCRVRGLGFGIEAFVIYT